MGTIIGNIDVAQVTLYVFWLFFAGLIFYLRREDKREGYPLESDRSEFVTVQGFPALPEPKTFHLTHGGTQLAPRQENDTREIRAEPVAPWPGAPLEPTGDPMRDAVGPASYALRTDEPDRTPEGANKIVPLRMATDFYTDPRDPDPVGLPVIAGDGVEVGVVCDVWIDRSEFLIRYLEIQLAPETGSRNVLLPLNFARVRRGSGMVVVHSIFGKHFAHIPEIRNPDQITLLEEDKITAYFGGGTLYAAPSRLGPWI